LDEDDYSCTAEGFDTSDGEAATCVITPASQLITIGGFVDATKAAGTEFDFTVTDIRNSFVIDT
jgi:hypothetical protein